VGFINSGEFLYRQLLDFQERLVPTGFVIVVAIVEMVRDCVPVELTL
jgi:hypothetical protein